MSTQLKLRRGTTAQHSTFTGAEGEITVDTTKDTVVVHDGATAGGIPLAKESGSALSPTSVTLSSGTANGVAYLNGSKVLTTGSALTYNGTSLSVDAAGAGPAYLTISQRSRFGFDGNNVVVSDAGTFKDITFITSGSEQMRLTSTGLGIGVSNPSYSLDVQRTFRFADTIGGSLNGYFGCANTGSVTLNFGGTTTPNKGRILYSDNVDSFLFYTNSTERMRITSGGEVYIAGTTDQGAYNLQCNGTGVWGAGAYVNGSDASLKENVTTLDNSLSLINAMRPVTFTYKEDYSKDRSVQTGFIAQELKDVLAGKDYLDGIVQAGPEHLNVAYQNIIPLLVKAVQELTARVAQLEGN